MSRKWGEASVWQNNQEAGTHVHEWHWQVVGGEGGWVRAAAWGGGGGGGEESLDSTTRFHCMRWSWSRKNRHRRRHEWWTVPGIARRPDDSFPNLSLSLPETQVWFQSLYCGKDDGWILLQHECRNVICFFSTRKKKDNKATQPQQPPVAPAAASSVHLLYPYYARGRDYCLTDWLTWGGAE